MNYVIRGVKIKEVILCHNNVQANTVALNDKKSNLINRNVNILHHNNA